MSDNKNTSLRFFYLIFVFLLLYAFFDMRSSQVTGNSGVSRQYTHYALVILIILHALAFVYFITKSGKMKIAPICLSVLIITFWVALLDAIKSVDLWTMLTHCGLSSLWFFDAYFYFEYRARETKIIKKIQDSLFILLLVYAVGILYYMVQMYKATGRLLVSNLAYNLLVLYPWFMIKNNDYEYKHKNIVTIIVVFFVVISLKRGAMFAFVLMYFSCIICEGKEKGKKVTYFIKLSLAVIFFLSVVLIVDNYLGGALLSRFTISELQSGSGRNYMYKKIISALSERSMSDLIFGIGSGASSQLLGTGAHNEWLEFIYSFGIIGIALYFIFIISMLRMIINRVREKDIIYIPLLMSFIYVLTVGLYGGVYFMQSTYFVIGLFGLSEAKIERAKQ